MWNVSKENQMEKKNKNSKEMKSPLIHKAPEINDIYEILLEITKTNRSSDAITNDSLWVGGIMVGVVISGFVAIISSMLVALVRKKRRAKEDNTIIYNNSYAQNCAL